MSANSLRSFEKSSTRLARTAVALVMGFALVVIATPAAQAQTYAVLHNFTKFTGGADGTGPYAGLTIDIAGNLYGSTPEGGIYGCGVVFQLRHLGAEWIMNLLHEFAGQDDGSFSVRRVSFGPDGSIYGTSWGSGCSLPAKSAVFNLRVPATACKTALCPWTETTIFPYGRDFSDLTFDQAGDIYLTSFESASVLELTPSNGGWKENFLYTFSGEDGWIPISGVIFDQSGNLYGTTYYGGSQFWGTVYQLKPSGARWTESVLYSFQAGSDGENPTAGLVLDSAGNLYGATTMGGVGGGTVFELTPSGGTWAFILLYSFEQTGQCSSPGVGSVSGPASSLVLDAVGNLYGATCNGAYGQGNVFKLTRSGGGWTYTSLHDFCADGKDCSDGAWPSGVAIDAKGNVYGTTQSGGAYGGGVVFAITP